MEFDLIKITNPEAKRFFLVFSLYRKINRDFFEKVLKEQYDFRIVVNEKVKSDSVCESLAHMINVQRSYLNRARNGEGDFTRGNDFNLGLVTLSKDELLKQHELVFQELYKFLCNEKNTDLKVKVPWSTDPISALRYLWGMNDHEIFHNGWNVAVMDHLGIERFDSFKDMWG